MMIENAAAHAVIGMKAHNFFHACDFTDAEPVQYLCLNLGVQ